MPKIKVRRDAKLNDRVLESAELGFKSSTKELKIGDGSTAFDSLPHFVDSVENKHTLENDKIYDGVDLTTKFATEISSHANAWAWIKARTQANNFEGIHVGDYIPFALTGGKITDGSSSYTVPAKTMRAQIMGIDTYYGYGDSTVGHHIDFKTAETIGVNIPWNPTDNNNGTSTTQNPWLASKIYACLNGVNNYSTSAYNSVAHGYNASSLGVYQMLPAELRGVIIQKRMYAPTRYSASALLTASTAGAWINMGNLWLPLEMEVHGAPLCSASKDQYGVDRDNAGSPVQYPLFRGANGARNNKLCNRAIWWLASVASGVSSRACFVSSGGFATALDCASADISAPVCFRVG